MKKIHIFNRTIPKINKEAIEKLRKNKAIIGTVLEADNLLANYKKYLRVDLPHFKKIYRHYSQYGLNAPNFGDHEKEIRLKINKLNKFISTRINYLLHAEEDRLFCEAFPVADGKYSINPNSVTKTPITQLGAADLNRGYIILTQVKVIRKPNAVKPMAKLELTPIKLDLKTGIVTNAYKEEI